MKKGEKIGKMVFKDHYNSLSETDKTTFRDELLKVSGMSYVTFYHKLRNMTFKPLEQAFIANYFSLPVHLLFPEYAV